MRSLPAHPSRSRPTAAPPTLNKPRTPDLPDLARLCDPPDAFAVDVQGALLRRSTPGLASLSLAEQIAARLAALIALDVVRPGQRILEEEVGARLGVSRAPVREALRLLERDRLLVVRPRHGAQVSRPSADELRDIFEVRASLWGAVVEHVMRATPRRLHGVAADGLAALEAAADRPEAYSRASFRLTVAAAGLCGNDLLRDMAMSVALQTLRYARLGFARPGAIDRSLAGWRELAAAVAAGDVDAAVDAARARIRGSRDAALEALAAEAGRTPGDTNDAPVEPAAEPERPRRTASRADRDHRAPNGHTRSGRPPSGGAASGRDRPGA